MPRRRVSMSLLVVLDALVAVTASAQPQFLRAGTEFRVNTYTLDAQRLSEVAVDADGDFVVVWRSEIQDGGSYGIFGRRFTANGVGQAAEFQVNLTTVSFQSYPDVAMDDDVDFVVVWQSYGQDGSEY